MISAIRIEEEVQSEAGGDPIILVCAADDRFAMPLAAMLYSVLVNCSRPEEVQIFVIDGNIASDRKDRIARVVAGFQARLSWLKPDHAALDGLLITHRFSLATYYRLLIGDLLPPQISKLIYLDCDLIVEADLNDLWRVDVGEYPLLAVQDSSCPLVSSRLGLANYRELGLAADLKYFNAGVLVVNLRKWREQDVGSRAISYVRENEKYIRFVDQDALNGLLAGSWGELDPRWNGKPGSALDHRFIVHFTGNKPWRPECEHSANCRFDHYLKESGWFDNRSWKSFYMRLRAQRAVHKARRIAATLPEVLGFSRAREKKKNR